MQKIKLAILALLSTLLLACVATSNPITAQADFLAVYQSIDEGTLKEHTKILASDEFEGRLPTTVGEQKTLDYLITEFKKLGYQPGNGSSYLQPVELLEMTASPDMTMSIGKDSFTYKEGMIASTKHEQKHVKLSDSDVVFVGFGINAPEYDWNDYQDLDVKGKTVVILVNDPGFENPKSGKFQGKTMTYYGRWTYKYEEASRQGAAAAIIVHEPRPASYGWSVVANSWSGPQYSLVSANGNADRVAVEGWLSADAAKQVFRSAGLNFAGQKARALAGPYHQSLNVKASVTINSKMQKSISHNVIATLPGSRTPNEHLIYSAHWDHLGKDDSKSGDQIYNGAHDNATGTASALAIAKAFSELKVAPQRSVTFLVVTAEEQGLLGSQFYASHPVIPLDKTVANINMDAMNVLGRTKDVSVIGMGKSELEVYLAKAAKRQDRVLKMEDHPEAGYYYRSDHFNFAKQGIPALYAKGGSEPLDEQTATYRKRTKILISGCYHQVCDQFRENWDFSGVREDTQMLFEVGYDLTQSPAWPKWNAQSEFQRPGNAD
ncbi:MAG: Zn-dependent M28 family amino/carboxypeptidase [Paraglaciecola sp.]|jgi:Zn-dependent M28 family amino/carboxypeptidase